MKRISALILCFIMFLINIPEGSAYNYPSSFWSINPKYEAAQQSKNYNDVIGYGQQLINLMSNTVDCKEKWDVILTRYKEIGLAYLELDDYDNAIQTFDKLYENANWASPYMENYLSYAKFAKAAIAQCTPEIAMYTDGGTATYYGAKNEKPNGVLFGICADGETRSRAGNESMVLTYQEIGQNLLAYNSGVIKNAASEGLAVEFALNCPRQRVDIENITSMNSYLREISDLFKKYPNVPVYLRFAAEFDIWTDMADAESFKTAFRYVSEYFKSRNSNVAIVWSPNSVSSATVNIDDYYPGDSYVDWVGVSLYAKRYFLGDRNQPKEDEIVFETGYYSSPVIAIKDIVEKYGNRKPIMISEMGVGHRAVTANEDTTDFAMQRIREYYSYLPMVYPQVKLIAYFDQFINAKEERDNFELSSNSKLQNEFLKLVKGGRFIQDKYSNSADLCYRKIQDGITVESVFPISCYAHSFETNPKSVTYFIDDVYAGMSNEIPFSTYIDASAYSGRHTLKAIATFENGKTLTTQSFINISNDNMDITVEISGDKVVFDQEPLLYNDRTMVPMRKIFEELGATVTWDNATETATGRKGDRTVRVTVGQKKMYVNSKEIILDTAPIVVSDRTLVPVRAVAEGLGCDVDWNNAYCLVSITPKVFKWSEWDEDLPYYVDDDLYYIEEKELYCYREKEYYTTDYEQSSSKHLVDVEESYGNWSDWQSSYISETDTLDVEERTQWSPESYHYAHWCTGNLPDSEKRYRTRSYDWCDEAAYHDLGWFDSKLYQCEDDPESYLYYQNGEKYRCPNTCYRWYIIEKSGGNYTEYRSRNIYHTYTYWEWGEWSDWDEEDPYDYYDWDEIEVDEMTVYRYKEK